MMNKSWIVIDLDGTLCNIDRRVNFAQAKDWEAFHAGIPGDEPYDDVTDFLHMALLAGKAVLCLTGRHERYAKATKDWIQRRNLGGLIDNIHFRPDGDQSRDGALKLRLMDEFFGGRQAALDQVSFVLEDRDSVVEAYRGAGFSCWQVRVGGY